MQPQDSLTAMRLRAPRAAAIAGILFAVLLMTSFVLLRRSVPADPLEAGAWLKTNADSVTTALNLLPFAGIAFLWFVAVVRSQLGRSDDRFIETVFLGSGLVFVATLFVAAAALTGVLRLGEVAPVSDETAATAMAFGSSLLGQFGTRMAAVFTLTLTTAARLGGSLPRWMLLLGYAVGLVLLLSPPLPALTQFAFPAWVAMLSLAVLLRRRGADPDGA